ncbi:MAG: hypothetical protein MUC60_04545 [Oscillatoria sp. Prado101]|nr:hypothetical protein [Oscillatoria sp. Prado101]
MNFAHSAEHLLDLGTLDTSAFRTGQCPSRTSNPVSRHSIQGPVLTPQMAAGTAQRKRLRPPARRALIPGSSMELL